MTDQEIILKREVARLQEQVRLLMLQKQQLELKVEKMKCCATCKHARQGEYGNRLLRDCECEIKQPTKYSYGKYHEWDDKCDKWELTE